jgi:predicted esterase
MQDFTISLQPVGEASKRIAPGQTRPIIFRLGIQGNKTTGPILPGKQVALLYRSSGQETTEKRLRFTIKLQNRSIYDPHKVTHLHPGGIVSYAMLRAPAKNSTCQQAGGATSAPVLLQFHGAGVDADNDMVAHALDPVPDLCAWVLFPTGVTSWSADDWHNWGFADVQAAVDAIPAWIEATGWHGVGVDTEKWVASGHSNGGQGTWYTLLHHPDKVFAAAPVSGYLSIHAYVPYQLWKPMDPKRRAIIEASANSYRHELLASNAKGIPIYQQHGSADDNVPTWHSRQMSQLLAETGWPSNYSEISGKGHWWETVMTTDGLQRFYREQLSSSRSLEEGFSEFELVVANPADTGSKDGVEVTYLVDPGQVGKIRVSIDRFQSSALFSTSNIFAFEIQDHNYKSLVIDNQEMRSSSTEGSEKGPMLRFYKKEDGGWTNKVSYRQHGKKREGMEIY